MSMPKPTDNWCRRKSRRLRRRGVIGRIGCGWISTVSRRSPYAGGLWRDVVLQARRTLDIVVDLEVR